MITSGLIGVVILAALAGSTVGALLASLFHHLAWVGHGTRHAWHFLPNTGCDLGALPGWR